MGPIATKDMQTHPPFSSGDLDIKDAQCSENRDGREISYYITSR